MLTPLAAHPHPHWRQVLVPAVRLPVLVGGRKIPPVVDVAPEVDAHPTADAGIGAVRPVLLTAARYERRG